MASIRDTVPLPKPTIPTTPLEGLIDETQRGLLANYLKGRIQSVEASLSNYREKRQRYEQQMNDNFDWRRGGGASRGRYARGLDDLSAIFDLQNDTLNIVGGFAAFMTARTVDDIFGTEPYYALSPEGLADDVLAQSMQKHSEWKLRRSGWKEAGLDAIETAVGIGEAAIKSAWVREVDVYETRETVLVDLKGKPVLTVDGDYIYQADVELGQAQDTEGVATQVMLVKKDPSLALDVRGLAWNEMEIEQTNVSYNNVKSDVMHYGDLLIPENVASVNESDFIGHRFQKRLSQIRSTYPNLSADVIAILQVDTADPKTAAAKANAATDETGEHEPTRDIPDPFIELVECWIKYDPIGDGRTRRMYIVYARSSQKILTMDYIANVTPEGALPFHIVTAFKVKNRWYGRGYFEIYEKAQEFIDRHLNYIAYRNRYHSNPTTFFDPSLLLEDEETEDFEIRPDKSYRLKPGTKLEDFIQVFEFPDLDERTWQLMQMMIQVVQVRSGVTSAAQGEVSSLPSTSTATGIESILQSASTLARMPMGQVKNGLEQSLLYCVKLVYANLDQNEVYTYFEGDTNLVGTLEAAKVKDLDMNVRLLLTRFKQRENIEAAGKAIDLVTGRYLPLPEPEKAAVRPLFVQAVKGLGFDQADTIVRPPIVLPPDPLTGQPQGQMLSSLPPPQQEQPGAPPTQPPKQSEAAPPPPAK